MKQLLAAMLVVALALFPVGASAGNTPMQMHEHAASLATAAHNGAGHEHALMSKAATADSVVSCDHHADMDGMDHHASAAQGKAGACASNCCDMACHAIQTVEAARLAERTARSFSLPISVTTLKLAERPFGIERPPRLA